MKKLAAIFFVFIYILSNIGVFADIHLCGGSVTNVNVWQSDDQYKCECKEMTDNNCCHDIHVKASAEAKGISLIPYTLKSYSAQYIDLLFSAGSEIHTDPFPAGKIISLRTNWRHWQPLQLVALSKIVLRS